MDRSSTLGGSRCVQDPADSSARPATTVGPTASSTSAGLQTIPEVDDTLQTDEIGHVFVHDSSLEVTSGQSGPDIGLSSLATKPESTASGGPESQSLDLLHGEIDSGSTEADEKPSPTQSHGQPSTGLLTTDPTASEDTSLDLFAYRATMFEPLALHQLSDHSCSVASYVTARTSSVTSYHTAPSMVRRTQQSFAKPSHMPRASILDDLQHSFSKLESPDKMIPSQGFLGKEIPYDVFKGLVEKLAEDLVSVFEGEAEIQTRCFRKLVARIARDTESPSANAFGRNENYSLIHDIHDLLAFNAICANLVLPQAHRATIKQLVSDYTNTLQTKVLTSRSTPAFSSEWMMFLHSRGIILDPADELDWSGRGQHVEYLPAEEKDIPLQTEEILGHSATVVVESVRCRRIRLARKKIRCIRKLKKEDFVGEVELLQRLRHAHIVRVVGTYTLRKDLAILLYPATPWNLESFMDDMLDRDSETLEDTLGTQRIRGFVSLNRFFSCLAHALEAIHASNVKHMDLKPKNLLVGPGRHPTYFKIYIADFGIARAYKSAAEAETASVTAFTPRYAAPEVVSQETRGLSSDIFSLGCIYLEMLATLRSCDVVYRGDSEHNERQELAQVSGLRSTSPAYSTHIEAITIWYKALVGNDQMETVPWIIPQSLLQLIPQMLDRAPERRPTASELSGLDDLMDCGSCDAGPEPFEAADDDFT